MTEEWITVACLFDSRPDRTDIEGILRELKTGSSNASLTGELDMIYWDTTDNIQQQTSSIEKAARTCLDWDTWMVSLDFQGFELRLSHTYSSTDDGSLSGFPHLDITATVHPFVASGGDSIDEEIQRRRRRFVNVLSDFLTVADPVCAFGGRSEGRIQVSEDTVQALLRSTTPPLFEYNLFNPNAVEAIGRDQIINAPAWHVEELESSRVFLISHQVPHICSPRVNECLKVAEHLGLAVAEPER